MAYKVLMVCTGNICRSAMAKVVLQTKADQLGLPIEVDSAGISSEEAGNPIDYRAQKVLREAGYVVPEHAARKILRSDLQDFDLILAMTDAHYRAVKRLGEPEGSLLMYRSFEPGARSMDVPDPWYGGMDDFRETLRTIEAATPEIIGYIERQN
jgi:Protein-tyrosine-phosphatase